MTLDVLQVDPTPQDGLAPRQRRWPILLVAFVLAGAALHKLAGLGVQRLYSLIPVAHPTMEPRYYSAFGH